MEQVFTSDRISFVKVSEELIPDYLTMVNDKENVGRFISALSNETVYSAENEIAWVCRKLEEGAPVFSMIEKATGKFIGNIELMDRSDREGELGIAITAKMQDRGFGSEAIPAFLTYVCGLYDLQRVTLKARPFNVRALHVYEKCGFRIYDRTETDVFMEYLR